MLFSSLGLMILRPGMSEQLGASALYLAMMTAMNVRYQPHLHVLQLAGCRQVMRTRGDG